ncbi:hypothetical protein [Marinobacterium sp. BA1]|uniref:hypothetical protein n=1 Tax=Marinobacterium sp. BA1 TaxID=3138931 RepID=UPI0032E5B6B9
MSAPRIHTRKADNDEHDHILRAMNACARSYQDFNNFWFDDELVSSEGCRVELYVPVGTTKDAINGAYREARGSRDVVAFTVVECPDEWFKEVTLPKPRTIREMLWEGERPSRLIKQVARIQDDQERADAIDMILEAYLDSGEQRAYMAYEMAARDVVPDACMGHVRNIVLMSEASAYWDGAELWNEHIEPNLSKWQLTNGEEPIGAPFYSLSEAQTVLAQATESGVGATAIEEIPASSKDPLAHTPEPTSHTLQH